MDNINIKVDIKVSDISQFPGKTIAGSAQAVEGTFSWEEIVAKAKALIGDATKEVDHQIQRAVLAATAEEQPE